MKNKNILFLIIGISLIIISLYIFTRPAIYQVWDFSNTGEIGDTIGGITAPIINLVGAYLVYLSFQAQITANKIQNDALTDEKEKNANYRIYDNYTSLYESLKNRLDNLEFVIDPIIHRGQDGSVTTTNHLVYRGLNALNEYVIRIEDTEKYMYQKFNTFGIFLNFQFILKSIEDLIERINDNNSIQKSEKEYLIKNIRLFYEGFLKTFAERIIAIYPETDSYNAELKRIKLNIDKKISA
jgi:hypothetical protein